MWPRQAHLGEDHDMRLQQRYGGVPRAEALAQVLDQLARQLRLRLTQSNALQQRL